MRAILAVIMLVALIALGCASENHGRDPQIASMLVQIDRNRIEANVRTLESFGTRHTLSETESDSRGIGAARRWIKAQLDQCAQISGGRLRVEFQEQHISTTSPRVSRPVDVLNVVATLPGAMPQARDRFYIVCAHYDSRNLDPNDAAGDAPGANDDASGTAAVLEMARAMCRHKFDATIIFALVAGEEQGLLGSAALAEQARREHWNVD